MQVFFQECISFLISYGLARLTVEVLATEYAKKAVEEDMNNNHEEALQNYRRALDWFQSHLKYEKNEKQREVILNKV